MNENLKNTTQQPPVKAQEDQGSAERVNNARCVNPLDSPRGASVGIDAGDSLKSVPRKNLMKHNEYEEIQPQARSLERPLGNHAQLTQQMPSAHDSPMMPSSARLGVDNTNYGSSKDLNTQGLLRQQAALVA